MRYHSSPQRSCAENANERCLQSYCVRIDGGGYRPGDQDRERFGWTDALNVARADLEYAVKDVRLMAVDVRCYLGKLMPVR
jgi:hypothetical protein